MHDQDLVLIRHQLTTSDGWKLRVVRTEQAGKEPKGHPVLFVHGYGMNGYVFNHHPKHRSLATVLLEQGFDPWSVDLRGTSTAKPPQCRARPTLAAQAFIDLPETLAYITKQTGVAAPHAIGCSLGGALLYALLGQKPQAVSRLVTMGSPLVMSADSAPLKIVKRFATIAPYVTVHGTRIIARWALPLVTRLAPNALWFYLNPNLIDLSDPLRLTRTVEDPSPEITKAMAAWIKQGDVVLQGTNVTEALHHFKHPLLVMYAADDAMCTPRSALSAVQATGGPVEAIAITAGDEPVRHADIFVGTFASNDVFPQVAAFLHGDKVGAG